MSRSIGKLRVRTQMDSVVDSSRPGINVATISNYLHLHFLPGNLMQSLQVSAKTSGAACATELVGAMSIPHIEKAFVQSLCIKSLS